MGDWLAITDWQQCQRMARPGIVFEIQNVEGLSLFAPCTVTLPAMPFDWKSAPIRFRAVVEGVPVHSGPIPAPKR